MQSSSGVNRVFLVGHIETSPKRHNSMLGRTRLCFSLTTKENVSNSRPPSEHIELHNLVIDADHPDIRGRELFKGDQLYIMGKAQTRVWNDAEKVRRYKTEIWVSQLEVL